jgi:histidyl-tRNA synthetase
MKRASRLRARFAISIGEDEIAKGMLKLRDLDSGVEEEVTSAHLLERLRA